MASGKSAIGRLLAEALEIPFIDLDQTIEAKEGMSISEIFSSKGEIYFRKKEYKTVTEILDKNTFVLSTGGGTPCYGKNMEDILIKSTHTFYLKLSILNLVSRIAQESHTRPLVKDIPKNELPEFIGKHLFERSFFYSQAKVTIDCNEKAMDEVVQNIRQLL